MAKQTAREVIQQLRQALETMIGEAGGEPDLDNPQSESNFDEAYAADYAATRFLKENPE